MSPYYVAGPVLGAGHTAMGETDRNRHANTGPWTCDSVLRRLGKEPQGGQMTRLGGGGGHVRAGGMEVASQTERDRGCLRKGPA